MYSSSFDSGCFFGRKTRDIRDLLLKGNDVMWCASCGKGGIDMEGTGGSSPGKPVKQHVSRRLSMSSRTEPSGVLPCIYNNHWR